MMAPPSAARRRAPRDGWVAAPAAPEWLQRAQGGRRNGLSKVCRAAGGASGSRGEGSAGPRQKEAPKAPDRPAGPLGPTNEAGYARPIPSRIFSNRNLEVAVA
jgi:hypothetical protein